MAFADKYRKLTAPTGKTGTATSSLKGFAQNYRKNAQGIAPVKRAPIQPVPRPDIRESANYKRALDQSQQYQQEAQKANSFSGMALNTLKAAPRATADVLLGNPAKFIASTAEVPGIVLRGGRTTQREYKIPGLSPFKSFQSDFANTANDVIEGKRGLGRAAWELAQVPLAGMETSGIAQLSKSLGRLASNRLAGRLPQTEQQLSQAIARTSRPNQVVSENSLYPVIQAQTPKNVNEIIVRKNLGKLENIGRGIKTSIKSEKVPKTQQIDGLTYVVDRSQLTPREKALLEERLTRIKFRGNDSFSIPIKYSRTTDAPNNINIGRKLITSGERILQKQGNEGQQLLKSMRSQQLSEDILRGKWVQRINEFTGKLSKEEKMNLTDVLEGKAQPVSKEVGTAAKVMRNWLNKIGKTAEDRGFQIRVPSKEGAISVPFKMRENYFPRQYNFDKLQKGAQRERALQAMVDNGSARNKAEAQRMLDTFIKENSQRRAGNLENARMFDIPGYERDAQKALTQYAQNTARRFTEAEAFGMKDEKVAELIGKIADKGGDYNEVQKIFDYTYKGAPQSKVVNAIQQYNLATKLSMSFVTNSTQSINTISKAGFVNTVKAAIKGFSKDGRDLAELSGVYDDLVMAQETNHLNRFVRGVLKPFSIVERFNRRTAANAGKLFAEELAKNPDTAYSIRQLESLGIDPKKIVAGKLTENDLLTAANNMSRMTQFKISPIDIPPSWKSPTGKLLTQFKSFSFMQTKFVRDQILKEAAKGNLAPFVRFVVTAPIASYAAQIVRNKLTGRVPKEEEKNIDIRRWDAYLKAMGTIPTEMATQAKFVYDRINNKYSTPLQNISTVASSILGPTVGDVGAGITALENKASTQKTNEQWYSKHPLAQRDPNLMLKRYAVSKVPFFGQYLKNTAFGFKPTEASIAKDLAKQAIENNNPQQLQEAINKDPYLFNEAVIRNVIGKKVKEMSSTEKKFYDEIKQSIKTGYPFYTNK